MTDRKIKILVIDDNKDNLLVLKALIPDILPESEVLTAGSGQEGIVKAVSKDPDVILLDILMPGIDGYEVCRRLKMVDRTEDIPVLFLTAIQSTRENRMKALDSGAQGFLTKPVDEVELTAQLKSMIKIRNAIIEKRNENIRLSLMVEQRTRDLSHELSKRIEYEKMLKESEERFRILFEKAPLGYQSLDAAGHLLDVNQQWLDTFGYSKNEVINQWFGDFLSSEDHRRFSEKFHEFIIRGSTHCIYNVKCKDGKVLTIAFEGKIALNSDGSFKQTHCILQDITRQKQAEDELMSERDKNRLYLNTVNTVIMTMDTGFKVTMINSYGLDLLKYKESELLGKNWFNVAMKNIGSSESVRVNLERMLNTGLSSEDFLENDVVTATGKVLTIVWKNNLLYDKNGKITGILSSGMDITDRKNLENTLTEERNIFETTLKSVGDAVISIDSLGNVLFMNPIAEKFTGFSFNEASGVPLENIRCMYSSNTKENSVSEVRRVFTDGVASKIRDNTVIISQDGIVRPVEADADPIFALNGEIIGVVLVIRDVTERLQKHEELIQMSYHDQLTGLYNRRFFEEELKRLDTPRNLPFSIIMGDVNGLKLINDSFGYSQGDRLLKMAAKVIKKGCRADDIVARLGGDEFVVLLPETAPEEVEKIIGRIKTLAEKVKIESLGLSISFGLVTKQSPSEEINSILKSAEDNLYKHKLYESLSMRSKTIDLIINTLFEKSNREMLHSKRVSTLCEQIAKALEYNQYTVNDLKIAGLMHDIGKIGIDEKVLNSSTILDEDGWKEMRRHPEIGYRILSSVNEFSEMASYILQHHERLDGKGYPKGLSADQISEKARIIAIADAYDAMTSDRLYRKALPESKALIQLKTYAGTQFDPAIAQIFVEKVLGQIW